MGVFHFWARLDLSGVRFVLRACLSHVRVLGKPPRRSALLRSTYPNHQALHKMHGRVFNSGTPLKNRLASVAKGSQELPSTTEDFLAKKVPFGGIFYYWGSLMNPFPIGATPGIARHDRLWGRISGWNWGASLLFVQPLGFALKQRRTSGLCMRCVLLRFDICQSSI